MNSADEDDAGAVAPGGIPYDNKRQAELYWRQIEQLKGAAVCIRLSRNQLARRVKTVDVKIGRASCRERVCVPV